MYLRRGSGDERLLRGCHRWGILPRQITEFQ